VDVLKRSVVVCMKIFMVARRTRCRISDAKFDTVWEVFECMENQGFNYSPKKCFSTSS
jgi:hypothetical protein